MFFTPLRRLSRFSSGGFWCVPGSRVPDVYGCVTFAFGVASQYISQMVAVSAKPAQALRPVEVPFWDCAAPTWNRRRKTRGIEIVRILPIEVYVEAAGHFPAAQKH